MMASSGDVLSVGRPMTASSLMFRPESKLRVSQPRRSVTNLRPIDKSQTSPPPGVPNADLSSIEVENLLRSQVKSNYTNLLQGFRNYDINRIDAVSKGEFRRVLEAFALPLTSEQFDSVIAKVPVDRSGAYLYVDFLEKFYGKNKSSRDSSPTKSALRYIQGPAVKQPAEINMDQVERQLQEKIKPNAKDFIKSFHLFDYNRDGRIQRHDFRKVLDNNAIKLSDNQFDKLWMRYDFHHSGTMDYKDFLIRLGVRILDNGNQASRGPALGVNNRSNGRPDESISPLKHLNIDQLDREFRKRMRSNYVNVKRAMNACDRHNDGFISISDLRAVLSAFTIPMSEQLFTQLMERAEIRASGQVCWGAVLSKFQDPQNSGNGQTIPIKSSHKYFPVKQSNDEMSSDDLWNLLHKHVSSAYGSFQNAFLQMDDGHTGRLTKKDIRKVLQSFKLKLTKTQLSKLMKRLDPENTNSIDYQAFLSIFEPRETNDGHKWLHSEHRYNDVQKPVILAWDTVDDILRQKLTENWADISPKFKSYDPLNSAKINKSHLRKIITNFCIPISDEHFDFMISRIEDREGDKVNYVEWLAKLGVDVRPGDITGLSTQIYNSHNTEMDKRYNDQIMRHAGVDQTALDRTSFMSAEEIIIRLRDRISQHSKTIRDAFLLFDKKNTGKISKRHFREVLTSQGMLLDDETFAQICNLLKFNNGTIDYYTFVEGFDDPRGRGEIINDIKRSGNHKVNKHRGDDFGLTAEQAENKLRNKLRENFSDLRGAFYKFDADHNGLVSKSDFQRMLDSFMIVMSDGQFDILCNKLGLTDKKKRISYHDFLRLFEIHDTAEGHQWLVSDHKYNHVQETPNISAEQAHIIIQQKGHRQWKDLSKAFIALDTNKSGTISKAGLREVLHRFIIPMTEDEFTKLWRRYDTERRGHMTHEQFLQKIGVNFAPGDDSGTSKQIVDSSMRTLDEHHTTMVLKHEQQTYNQANAAWNMPVETIFTQLRDRIRDSYGDMHKAFKSYDHNKTGRLSTEDIKRVLNDFSYLLSDDQFIQLMSRIGFTDLKSKLDYTKFLSAFEEGRGDAYPDTPPDVQNYKHFDSLSPEKADTKLKRFVSDQSAALTAIFQAIDTDNTGRVKVEDFRRILDSFCFKMTDAQFKSVINKLKSTGEQDISYPAFLDAYQSGTNMENVEFSDRLIADLRTPNDALTGDSFLQSLRDAVNNKFYHIARHFADIDYAKIGVVARDDFHDVIAKHCFRMTPNQFDNLWSTLKINQFGNADYRDFLKSYSSNQFIKANNGAADGRQSAVFDRRPGTQMSQNERELMFSRAQSRAASRGPSRAASTVAGRAMTPMINAETIESRIQAAVSRNWKKIQEQCRQLDVNSSGEIEVSQFKELCDRFKLGLELADFHTITTKFDVNNNGRFSYTHFLKHFVLTRTPMSRSVDLGERRQLESRTATAPVTPGPKKPTPGLTSDQFYMAMLRIRDTVLTNWKDMRRQFRKNDPTGSGGVAPAHFRNVLRQYNVNISEDEFYHMMTYYDKGMTGNISYNDFISHFLKAVQ